MEELVVDAPGRELVQVVGTGGACGLEIVGHLVHERIAIDATMVLRGHTTGEGGTLGLKCGGVEAVGGRLLLGQTHEQASRALVSLEVAGDTEISKGGILVLGTNGAPARFGAVEFGDEGGLFQLRDGGKGGRSVLVGALNGGPDAVVEAGAAALCGLPVTLHLETPEAGASYGGRLVDKVAAGKEGATLVVMKSGPGEQTFSGSNTFSGPLYVYEGRLRINGNQTEARGPVRIAKKATLAGCGTVGGSVRVDGVLLSDGISMGLRFASDLVLAPEASTVLKRNPSNFTTFAAFAGTGSVTVGGALKINVSEGGVPPGTVLRIFEGWKSIRGGFTSVHSTGNEQWDCSRLASDGTITAGPPRQ